MMNRQAPLSLKYKFERASLPNRPVSNPIERFGNLANQVVQYAPSIIPFLNLGRAEKIGNGILDPGLIRPQQKVDSLTTQVRIRCIEDHSGPLVEYFYDKNGLVNEVILLGSFREKYVWADQGNLLSVENSNFDKTQFRYLDDRLLDSIYYSNGSIFKYSYDESKQLSAISYPDAVSTRYIHDTKGQLIRSQILNEVFEYVWDESGSLQGIEFCCKHGNWGYKTNDRGQKLRIQFFHNSSSKTHPVYSVLGSWKYDFHGELLEVFFPNGYRSVKRISDEGRELTLWKNNGQTTYRLDKLGIVMGITNPLGLTTIFKRSISDGIVMLISGSGISFLAYNKMGCLKADRDLNGRGASYSFTSNLELRSITSQGKSVHMTWRENKYLKKIFNARKFSASITNAGKYPDFINIKSKVSTNIEMTDWLVKFLWNLQAMKQIRRFTDSTMAKGTSCP